VSERGAGKAETLLVPAAVEEFVLGVDWPTAIVGLWLS
jgi:hypothetical protein